jgi:magnesium transporter
MHAQGYRIGENNRLVTMPPERVGEEWTRGGAGYWLDIQGSCHEALEKHFGNMDFAIDPILLQLCEEDVEDIARVIPTEDALFFGLPVSTGTDDEPVGYLSALCLPRLLISLHPRPLRSLQEVAETLQRTSVLGSPTTSALVCGMLVHLSSLSVQLAQRVRRRVGGLTGQMDRDAERVEIEQLLAEKAAVRELETLDEESSPVYAMLKVSDNDQLNLSELDAYYQVVLGNTAFLTRIVERLEARLDDLHQRFVVNAQEKTNQRLALLTLISAIFLPLTLLAGIYGMNFEVMPELGLPYACPAALGAMAGIAFGMWRFFKRKGWFD